MYTVFRPWVFQTVTTADGSDATKIEFAPTSAEVSVSKKCADRIFLHYAEYYAGDSVQNCKYLRYMYRIDSIYKKIF